MGVFEVSKEFNITVPDLDPVAETVMQHFRGQGYDVSGERTIFQGWDISLHKGNIFKAVLGMKSALKIQIETAGAVTRAHVGIGIFGQQALPTAISMLVFWPVLVTQVWGLVTQARLDQEAIEVVERALRAQAGEVEVQSGLLPLTGFCQACGAPLSVDTKFCTECGARQSPG